MHGYFYVGDVHIYAYFLQALPLKYLSMMFAHQE